MAANFTERRPEKSNGFFKVSRRSNSRLRSRGPSLTRVLIKILFYAV